MKTSSLQAQILPHRQSAELDLLPRPNIKSLRHPSSQALVLDRILLPICLAVGLIHAWLGRLSMNPDGISYLDVGDAFVHRNWAVAVNAWWSPLYPWTIGLVLRALGGYPKWEFPIVHLVNFAIFVLALFAFRFLLRALLDFVHNRNMEANVVNL